MSTRGRQYPDGPLEPPPDAGFARLPDLEGWPDNSLDFWPQAAAAFLASLDAEPAPGPPYTHAIAAPGPWRSRSGRVVYRPPMAPAFTFTIGEIRPPGPRTEITADFCQCRACRAERCEP